VAKNKISTKSKLTENKYVQVYYRNQLLSLIALLDRKEDYFNLLKGKRIESIMPLKSN
jgi:hypothetical protein